MSGLSFPTFPSVPSMAQDTQEFVQDMLTEARTRADAMVQQALDVIDDLKGATFPTDVPAPPTPPAIVTTFSSSLGVDLSDEPDLGEISAQTPAVFTPDDIVIPNIASAIPEYQSLVQGLTIPEAPTAISVNLPAQPSIETDITIPDAPVANYGDIPALYPLELPDFVAPSLAAFDGVVPTFTAQVPSAAIDWAEPTYEAWIADQLKDVLTGMLAGGTGIPDNVERALWERERGRTDIVARAAIEDSDDEYGARGFYLPGGALLARNRAIRRENREKQIQQSRDRAIANADLEQKNRQFAVTTGATLENMFIQIFLQSADRKFQIAKYTVEARIQIFNAHVAMYNVEKEIFAARIDKFKADLQYALSQIEAYKARLQAEAVKGDLNKSIVEAYKSKIQAFQAQADAYRAVVQAASARADLQKNKVELYRTQIEGERVRVEAKKGEFDAYQSRIQGEVAKASLEESNARAFGARVQAITAKAELSLKEADVGLARSDQKLKAYLGNLQYFGELAQRQLQAIQARQATLEAAYRRDMSKFEVSKAGEQLNLQAQIETSRNLVAYFGAQIEMWKANVVRLTEYSRIQSESIRAAGQITSTLAAGQMAGTSVSTAFGGSVSRGESTSQGETYSETKTDTTSSTSTYETGTKTLHNYNHEA